VAKETHLILRGLFFSACSVQKVRMLSKLTNLLRLFGYFLFSEKRNASAFCMSTRTQKLIRMVYV
jgi:hypothetical protein